MTIGNIMTIAQSALKAAQTQVEVTSNNVSNVNTAGYSRKLVNQQELVAGGVGGGVSVQGVQNAADRYLQQASYTATAQSGQAQAVSSMLDRAQALFGDPTSSNSFFANLDNVYAAFSAASDTPSSTLLRQSAVSAVSTFLNSAKGLAASIGQLQSQASQQVSADVTTTNGLLQQISKLNGAITQANLSGGDATGSQDQQTLLLTQLSALIAVNVSSTATGGVTVRSAEGVYLAGDMGPATLAFSQSGVAGVLTATPPHGGPQAIDPGGGDIGGQFQLSQVELPQISAQLGEYVSQAVNQLNHASNASTAVPAPTSLTGQAMGMALSTAVGGFTGQTTIAVVNSAGVIQTQVAIDFGAGTMTVGATPTAFTPSNFLATLNGLLSPSGSAAFTNGALSVSASGAGNGVAIADDPTTPATNAGQGFSQFFGLNNLVASSSFTRLATGLTSASPNTFSGTIALQLTDANGAPLRQVSVAMPSGGTVSGVLSALNTGVGAYGSFSLDANGRLAFTANNNSAASVSLMSDSTANSAGGPNLSQMFGIGDSATAALTTSYSVRADIAQNPTKLPFATLNLSASAGAAALLSGDGTGAFALAQSGSRAASFAAAGGLAAASSTVSNYASQIAGLIGAKAANAENTQKVATATATQATSQLSSATGVNLDQELVNLTTYQQAYSASARLIQAATTMYDSLLQMVP